MTVYRDKKGRLVDVDRLAAVVFPAYGRGPQFKNANQVRAAWRAGEPFVRARRLGAGLPDLPERMWANGYEVVTRADFRLGERVRIEYGRNLVHFVELECRAKPRTPLADVPEDDWAGSNWGDSE